MSLSTASADRPVRILVVEDDTAVRDVVVTVLSLAGHDIVSAGSGADALREAAGGVYPDLLLTDINLPAPVDGFTLARQMRADAPALGVIYMSGDSDIGASRGVAGSVVLAKPFRRGALLDAVTQALPGR
ncbi:putative two component response regulator [Ameyamaea chiangmaiensis NBRC 103196]|uniref:Response regulator n=1 Tax=Ameyamaea chiangmaiensis TaxID=442969 RepID=A0A850PAZ7_9PROT|nr:response regulator [Ameyamaea chiangmaiensis]MBS4076382.1 response regulator [Ameyamaea chiangmaiensis]NVN41697.1 response regulator [Ameyamaea chiangmaiensis]GBQ63499.1 putative two component response regulator [Ameyamaea chiangmaiensis NBRC 103196]